MAKNEIKRISVNSLERITGDDELYTSFNWEGEEVVVKKRLSLSEMLTMVDGVTDGCFTDDGQYTPEARQFTTDCAILELYANFRLPSNIEKRYDIVCSKAVQTVISGIVEKIDRRQFNMIQDAITEKIDYRINTQTAAIERQINELSKQIEEIGNELTSVFQDTTPEEMKSVLASLANGVDEEKIVDAIVKARYTDATKAFAENDKADDTVIEFADAQSGGD